MDSPSQHIDDIEESTDYVVHDIEESEDYVVHDIEESEDYVVHDVLPPSESIPSVSEPRVHGFEFIDASGPASIFIPSRPTKTEWAKLRAATKSGFALTGVATLGQVGTHVGKADVGESEDDYMFRIALPGVKRDDDEFSCTVDPTGKILIKGVTTTGEKSVNKFSQVFEMQTQNLTPAGPFSITINLPGPVDPQQFSANFGFDGILEGTVKKQKHL
ncbi:alpha-crystallin domain-containing protein 22.3 [Citrus sinensis]|uniref:Alpha-crystallin domain-containing protein 22.3 n=1 Tax=Citrus sinensis TaxID=2711 RepID=A0ACB8KKV0_CITSI|nr:alpha-crystallin domain-containing protein 22.3 [Citrus sinensis]